MKEWVNTHTPFMALNGIRITKVWKDGAEAEAAVSPDSTNPYHMAHDRLLFDGMFTYFCISGESSEKTEEAHRRKSEAV